MLAGGVGGGVAGPAARAQAPALTLRAPARNAVAAPVAGAVGLTFSSAVSAGTAGNVRVFGNQRRGLRAGTMGGGGTAALRFAPAQTFAPGEQVSVTVPATVRGTNGVAARAEVYQFGAAAGAGPADFVGGPTLALPAMPNSVVTADVDNDGDGDLLVVDGNVRILLNDGAGNFAAGAVLSAPAGSTVPGVVVGDLDNDGDLDLLTTSYNPMTSTRAFAETWRNTGGSFAVVSRIALNGPSNAPLLADLDADGDLDFLTSWYLNSRVQVRFNDGSGVFGGGSDVAVAPGTNAIAVGDLDNDGDLDFVGVASVANSNTVGVGTVRLNTGNGTFANAPDIVTSARSNNLALGDLDGDGDVDMVSSTGAASDVLLNNGNGTFANAPDLPGTSFGVVVADLDGDGDLDVLRPQGSSGVLFLSLNDGTGRFGANRNVRVGLDGYLAVVADLDGDQALDIACVNSSLNSITVAFNRIPPPTIGGVVPGSGPVGTSVVLTGTGFNTTTGVLFNGIAASFVVNSSTRVTATVPPGASTGPLTLTTLGGTATAAQNFVVTGPPAPTVLARAPARNALTADPATAVALTLSVPVAAGTAGELRVWGSRSGGRRGGATSGGTATVRVQPARPFGPGEVVRVSLPPTVLGTNGAACRPDVYQFTTASGPATGQLARGGDVSAIANPSFMEPMDADGDGDLDLLACTATGIRFFTNDGRGTFAPGAVLDAFTRQQFGGPFWATPLDVDNDGDLDVLTEGCYFRNNSPGFTKIALANVPGNAEVGDLDGDGDLDLVWPGPGLNDATLRLNDGSGGFGPEVSFGLPYATTKVRLLDADNDGDLDLLALSRSDGKYTLSRNNGRASFGPGAVVTTMKEPLDFEVADVDGDGDLDLVSGRAYDGVADPTNYNLVDVRLNDGQGNFSGTYSLFTGLEAGRVRLGDLTGDGLPDLVLSRGGGELRVGLNNGSGGFGTLVSTSVPGNPYTLQLADYNGDGALDISCIAANLGSSTPLLYLNTLPPPVITSFSPTFGLPGTVVTVTGQYFFGVTGVALGSTAATSYTVNSSTSLTFTVPVGASTAQVYVYTPSGVASSPTVFTVSANPPDLDIIGAMDVSGVYHNVTVFPFFGTVGTLVGPLRVTGTLTVRGGGGLVTGCQPITGPGNFVMEPGATLSICDPAGISLSGPTGAVQLTGTRTFADGYYTYNGTQAQRTGDGLPAQVFQLSLDNPTGLTLTQPLRLAYRLSLLRGDLTTNGHGLTLLSDRNTQAWVDNTGGAVRGTATVQRYINTYRNPGLGYRHFSPPTANATVGSLATAGFAPVLTAAYNTAAAPGLVVPFPTVFGYDEGRIAGTASNFGAFDRGWYVPGGLAAPLAPGRGCTVQVGGGETVAFTGPLTNGAVALPLARAAAPVAEGGWHLLGNPYPSPLDWSRVALPAGLEPALYVFQSTSPYGGRYLRYINGIGNPVLDVAQGFFVRMATPASALTLTLDNAARRVDTRPQDFLRGPAATAAAADLRPQLTLRLTDAAGRADETVVYFEAGATPGFDPGFDARQLAANTGGEPSLWAVARTGEALGICGLPPLPPVGRPAAAAVPLGLALPQAGSFAFLAPKWQNMAGTAAWLDDAATGQTLRLDSTVRYAFRAGAGTLAGRFALRFGPAATALGTAANALAAGLGAWPNPARERLTVQVPPVPGATAFHLELLNALGQTVAQATGPLTATGGQFALPLTGRAAGLYVLRVRAGALVASRRVVVE